MKSEAIKFHNKLLKQEGSNNLHKVSNRARLTAQEQSTYMFLSHMSKAQCSQRDTEQNLSELGSKNPSKPPKHQLTPMKKG